MASDWYKTFFNKYYPLLYFQKVRFFRTQKEVEFISQVLKLSKGAKILDLACGQGRHTVKLAQKGYRLTGLDLSKKLLSKVKKIAKEKKITLRLIHSDMRKIPFANEFDGVISMFTSFGYFRKEKENIRVLIQVFKSLKPKGMFLLDLMNKKMILEKFQRKSWQEVRGNYILEDRSFNKKREFLLNRILIITPKKEIRKTFTLVHLYEPFEIKKKLESVGFKILKFYGDYDGNKFSPQKSPRMIILAQK